MSLMGAHMPTCTFSWTLAQLFCNIILDFGKKIRLDISCADDAHEILSLNWFLLFASLNRFFMPQSRIFHLCRDVSSWVEPVLSKD